MYHPPSDVARAADPAGNRWSDDHRVTHVSWTQLSEPAVRDLGLQLASSAGRLFIVDLDDVTYVDTFGWEALLSLLADASDRVLLAGDAPAVASMARLTHLEGVLHRFKDVAAARASLLTDRTDQASVRRSQDDVAADPSDEDSRK